MLFDCVDTPGLQPIHSPPVRLIERVLTQIQPYVERDQVVNIPKVAAKDTTLTVSNVNGGKTTFPVPSGTEIDIHVPGLHYNRTLSGIVSWGQVLMKSCKRGIGRSLASSCQNGSLVTGRRTYLFHLVKVCPAHRNTVITTHEHSAGARACLGRRCELLRCD